jgi:hypothetical protein
MTDIDKYTKLLLDKKDLQNPNSFEELGYIFMGPMIFNFFIWLKSELGNTDKILFNSREGYFFKEIYEIFKNKYNLPESVYFKTSRKLAAITSFKTKDDIYKTFDLHRFSGKLSNLLENRFGIKVDVVNDITIDTTIEIPNLDDYIDVILLEAKNTRDEYLKYIESVIGNSTNVLMVDSGFQGMTQHNIQKAYGLKFKGRYFIYKGNPFLDDVKGLYHFEKSNLRKNLIFFESIFIDKIGSYINIKNSEFINEEYNESLQYFNEKTQIIDGVKLFINDMFNFNIDSEDVSYEFADNLFNLMCTDKYIKNDSLFNIFLHDNYYVRDNIKKIYRN